jgi:hypothetical protein
MWKVKMGDKLKANLKLNQGLLGQKAEWKTSLPTGQLNLKGNLNFM